MTDSTQSVPPIILPELLGFSPHLLLDDIIDIANDAIRLTVDAMEEFILRWADERAASAPGDWDGKTDCEMGVISLQTLLESHADLAFDALEAWSLRNIFTFAPELPIVAPHHEGLNLREPDGSELATMQEIEELRRKIQIQRRLKRVLTAAVRKSASERRVAEARLAYLSTFKSMQSLGPLSEDFARFFRAVSSLPPSDPELSQLLLHDPGKRQWEISRTGYLNWAAAQLMNRARVRSGASGVSARVDRVVGDPEDIRAALEEARMNDTRDH